MKYKRILLKLSGEALAGDKGFGLNQDVITNIASTIKECAELGVQIAVVVGGGNFWRGRTSKNMDSARADYMGMLATAINALALCDALENEGANPRVQTAIEMRQIAEPYVRGKAKHHLEKGRIVIFGCGTGNPYFSTDTAAALRAAEMGVEAILLAKKVDAVYDSDPNINKDAVKFDHLSFKEVLNRDLKVMDSAATALCKDNNIPIRVFGLDDPENIKRVLLGETLGTLVDNNN